MDDYETLSPHEMGLQIPRHLHSEVSQKNDLLGIAPASRRGIPQVGATGKKPDRRGSSSRDHVHMLISIPTKYAVVGFIKGRVRSTWPGLWSATS
jgi:hypothetical protein